MREIKPNNIYLGDSYELIKELKDKSVDLIITDPPYEIDGIHNSKVSNGILKGRDYNKQVYGEIKNNGLDKGINLKILDDFVRVMKKMNIYIWCNEEQIYDYMTYFVKERGCSFEFLIWAKENPIAFCGTHYLTDKEYCLYFWEQGAKVYIPYERGKTVYISKTNVADKKDYKHPTIKPIEFIKRLIENSSERGGVVLDTFLGSGTTCVAAKELGRKYIGFEINPGYYNIAKDRLNGVNQKGQIDLLNANYEQLELL